MQKQICDIIITFFGKTVDYYTPCGHHHPTHYHHHHIIKTIIIIIIIIIWWSSLSDDHHYLIIIIIIIMNIVLHCLFSQPFWPLWPMCLASAHTKLSLSASSSSFYLHHHFDHHCRHHHHHHHHCHQNFICIIILIIIVITMIIIINTKIFFDCNITQSIVIIAISIIIIIIMTMLRCESRPMQILWAVTPCLLTNNPAFVPTFLFCLEIALDCPRNCLPPSWGSPAKLPLCLAMTTAAVYNHRQKTQNCFDQICHILYLAFL